MLSKYARFRSHHVKGDNEEALNAIRVLANLPITRFNSANVETIVLRDLIIDKKFATTITQLILFPNWKTFVMIDCIFEDNETLFYAYYHDFGNYEQQIVNLKLLFIINIILILRRIFQNFPTNIHEFSDF